MSQETPKSDALKKFAELEMISGRPHFPGRVDYDYPFISAEDGRRHAAEKSERRPSISRPRHKIIPKDVKVMVEVPNESQVIQAPMPATLPSEEQQERIFFEKEKLRQADERRGKDRTVYKLASDYEAGIDGGRVRTLMPRRKRVLGKDIEAIVRGYEDFSRAKDSIKLGAKEKQMALIAEREAEMAKLEADEAKRRKRQHEANIEDLMEKKDRIEAQEHEEKMSNLADKKESILEEEYEEAVKLAEAEAELKRAEEQQKMEAARRKWYDPKVRVPADMIYTPKNVREKQEDMDSLVNEIALEAARGRRRRRGD